MASRSLEAVLEDALRLLRLRGDGHLPMLIREELREALVADTPAVACWRCEVGLGHEGYPCPTTPAEVTGRLSSKDAAVQNIPRTLKGDP